MADSRKEVLRYPLRMLKFCGQNPETYKKKYFAVAALYMLLCGVALILAVLQFFYAKGNINAIAQNCEAVVAFVQMFGKVLIGATKIEGFQDMIGDTRRFWSTGKNPGARLENNFTNTLRLQQLLIRLTLLTMVAILTIPYYTKQLPTGIWTMENHDVLFRCTFVLQEVLVPLIIVFVAAFDSLFLGFCVHLRTQFKMLHDFLKDFKVSVSFSEEDERIKLNKLKSCIKYHAFLLRFAKNMRDAYSPVMLIEYPTVLLICCTNMYILCESKEAVLLLRQSFIMYCFLLQLAFYCIPLNYITDEAVTVSQGIYESDWYSKHIPFLRVIPLVIQRSQREIIFTAGGLIEMNCRTLINVLKVSWSVCTVMRALKNVE